MRPRWKVIWRACKGKHRVKVVCTDLTAHYRALVHKHFPNARMVADRFHLIRIRRRLAGDGKTGRISRRATDG